MQYTVRQGDCLTSIAHKFGFSDWRVIWNDSHNAAFKAERKNPNILFPGDELFIPVMETKEEACATDARHTFELTRAQPKLRLKMVGQDGHPLANKPFSLVVDGVRTNGTTDGAGMIEQVIPPDASTGEVKVRYDSNPENYYTWKLRIGDLDPGDKLSGAQARLANLGFAAGPIDGLMGPKTQHAIKAFQKANGMTPSGTLDAATLQKLLEHDLD